MLGTIFGIATTLGIGVVQLNYGLKVPFEIPENLTVQGSLILLSVIMATIPVTSGVNQGIRILSELNVLLALGLILFVLFGDTEFLLNALVLNVGDYVNRFDGHDAQQLRVRSAGGVDEQLDVVLLGLVGGVVAIRRPVPGAHLARAHLIRQFVVGTLIIPFVFTLLGCPFRQQRCTRSSTATPSLLRSDAVPERGFTSAGATPASPSAPRWPPSPACCSTSLGGLWLAGAG